MRKILIISNGAREHAIAEAVMNSKHDCELFCFGTAVNPGIKKMATTYKVGKLDDFEAISEFAMECQPDFAIIGPENPIGAGLADFLLHNNNLHCVAPLKATAQLESSKAFTRSLMEKHSISGMPGFRVFTNMEGLREYLENDLAGEYVIKADGLCGGKGVKLSGEHLADVDAGVAYAKECLSVCSQVVVEQKLVGQEFSLISLCDGETLYPFPVVQDHKRAYDGDKGPNTGGMGTYSDADHSLPFLKPEDVIAAKAIDQQTIDAVKAETGVPFTGVLYGGFIATKDGVYLIEYNARFGDPEVMNLLNLLNDDFIELCEAVVSGQLKDFTPSFKEKATVCVYVVPKGYPENPLRGEIVRLEKKDIPAKIYFASVDLVEEAHEYYDLKMSGSRAIAFVGIADTIELARQQALTGIETVSGPVSYRTDIGSGPILKNKIEMMEMLRN